REGDAQPLRRHPERGGRRRGLDGEGVEIPRQAHPRLTPSRSVITVRDADEEADFPDATDDPNGGHAHAWPGRASCRREVLSGLSLTDLPLPKRTGTNARGRQETVVSSPGVEARP